MIESLFSRYQVYSDNRDVGRSQQLRSVASAKYAEVVFKLKLTFQ